LGGSAIVVGVAAIALMCYAVVIESRAEALLKDLTALTVGRSTEADAQQFAEKHKHYLPRVSAKATGA
jgi:hypothetical protein